MGPAYNGIFQQTPLRSPLLTPADLLPPIPLIDKMTFSAKAYLFPKLLIDAVRYQARPRKINKKEHIEGLRKFCSFACICILKLGYLLGKVVLP